MDIEEVDHAILVHFLDHPDDLLQIDPRKPPQTGPNERTLSCQEARDILVRCLQEERPDKYSRIDTIDAQGTVACVVGICGSILYVSTVGASACFDVPDHMVQGTAQFA